MAETERPLDFADVCAVVSELADELPGVEAEVRARRQTDVRSVYVRPSSSGGGGPTNLRHNFETGEDNPKDGSGEPIPQHSDPVGEAAVHDLAGGDELGRALHRAFSHVCGAMRELESAQSELLRTTRVEESVTERSREWCWPCLEVSVYSPVVRDNAPNGVGRPTPRCRNHYDFFRWKKVDAPRELGVWWSEGRKVTSSMVDAALSAEAARRRKRAKKGRR